MEELKTILGDPVVGSLLGVAGIVISVAFYVLGLQSNKLCYRTSGGWSRNDRGVVLTTAIWNGGSKAIRSTDIGGKDRLLHLRTLNDKPFLDVKPVFITKDANEAVALINNRDRRTIDITFDHVNPNDGMVLALVLEGAAIKSGAETLELTGDMADVGLPLRVTTDVPNAKLATTLTLMLLLSWLIIFAGLFSKSNLLRWLLMTIGFSFYPFAAFTWTERVARRRFSQRFVDDFLTEDGYQSVK